MSPRVSPALAAWMELNDRQKGTLTTIYELDQANEKARRINASQGVWDRRPASEWRRIDFAHDPSERQKFGWTELQIQLELRGWDNQGNGSTMAALTDRGLLIRDQRPTTFGRMLTIALTREGRAAARAGTSLRVGPTPKVALSARAWQVLALLWDAGTRGKPLTWGYSNTIEDVLIDKHIPPLATPVPTGYAITDRGRDLYRQWHAAHTAAYPDVHAPHPEGAEAEPWPPHAEQLLELHRRAYRALADAWAAAYAMQQSAEQEAAAEPAEPDGLLPAAVVKAIGDRHQLWRDTARQRADLAGEHTADLRQRAERAARAYAAATLTAFQAVITHADPLGGLQPPDEDDDPWDEPRLPLPNETGIHAIDAQVKKLHAAAVGQPLRRRGPAPKRRHQIVRPAKRRPPEPGAKLAELAAFLLGHLRDGALLRRLHQ